MASSIMTYIWSYLLLLFAVTACSRVANKKPAVNITTPDPNALPPFVLPTKDPYVEQYAKGYLKARSDIGLAMAHSTALADWAYAANITTRNRLLKERQDKLNRRLDSFIWKYYEEKGWDKQWQNSSDFDVRRQFQYYSKKGLMALPEKDHERYNQLIDNMTGTYSTAKVPLCLFYKGKTRCNLGLEPELTQIMSTGRYYGLLEDAWIKWRNVTGDVVRKDFIEYVEIANKAAKLNNYTDMGEMWVKPYESSTFRSDVAKLWDQLKPFYQQLHAYVRRKLRGVYGSKMISKKGPIPANVAGNMWAQDFSNVYDIVAPFPNKPTVDVTMEMKNQEYTPMKMVKMADDFFQGINLTAMNSLFWNNSVFTNPPHTKMTCHASAWDFYNASDYRIKMCTEVNMEDLVTIHHEMGHIQYYMQYSKQPYPYRGGANPGFHEAVGDAIALSVVTPAHMHKVGLLKQITDDRETDLNFLMKSALSKVMFLPFGYLIDKYRWNVFNGTTKSENLNCDWWKLRVDLQGVKPPVTRNENQFDAGAKYHVVANVPYIRYFVSFIIQFQFHKAMCIKAGKYDPLDPKKPLHKCDVDKSPAAGNALASMLEMGSSRPWPDALEKLTGSRKIDVGVFMEYFKPLKEFLEADNKKHGEFVGWESEGEYCTK